MLKGWQFRAHRTGNPSGADHIAKASRGVYRGRAATRPALDPARTAPSMRPLPALALAAALAVPLVAARPAAAQGAASPARTASPSRTARPSPERPFGTLRQQAERQQRWLAMRLDSVLPMLMRKHGV